MKSIFAVLSLMLIMLQAVAAPAEPVPLPPLAGKIILTVSGDIAPGRETEFDLGRLKALDDTTFSTTTPWTQDKQTFRGTSLHALLDYLGVTEGVLTAGALNDYSIHIPVSDAVANGPILAFDHNGTTLPVRHLGPLWLVYPFDSHANYRTEVIYGRSIWQLTTIRFSKDTESVTGRN